LDWRCWGPLGHVWRWRGAGDCEAKGCSSEAMGLRGRGLSCPARWQKGARGKTSVPSRDVDSEW